MRTSNSLHFSLTALVRTDASARYRRVLTRLVYDHQIAAAQFAFESNDRLSKQPDDDELDPYPLHR